MRIYIYLSWTYFIYMYIIYNISIIIVTSKRNLVFFGENNVVFGDASFVINLITQNTIKTLHIITFI